MTQTLTPRKRNTLSPSRKQFDGWDLLHPRYRCENSKQDFETNLKKFRGMQDGECAPQAAWLRMKQDIENPNPQM
jgi:glutaminyl-tRNA synthetase